MRVLIAVMQPRPSIDDQPGEDSQRLRQRPKPKSVEDYVGRYPRILEKIALAAQLPSIEDAAIILRNAVERRRSYSEWVLMEYRGDAMTAVHRTLESRSKRPSWKNWTPK